MKTIIISLISFLFIFSALAANTIRVPSDYSTIQAGIDAATDGDTVLAADGTYSGNGNIMIKLNQMSIVVKSENGPANCTIDGQGSGFFAFGEGVSYEGLNAAIEGFTIRGFQGPGFYYYAGSCPSIINNVIESCEGGGIMFWGGAPLIQNNIIQSNNAPGIECSWTSANIVSNIIRDNYSNSAGAGINLYRSSALVINNVISGNGSESFGGGIYAKQDTSSIINNTIVYNSSPLGAGLYLTESNSTLKNNIIAFSESLVITLNPHLSHWRPSNIGVTYSYRDGVLSGATLHEGFINNGPATEVTIKVPDSETTTIDTTIFVEANERYSLLINCTVNSTSPQNSMISVIYTDTDTLEITSYLYSHWLGTAGFTLISYGDGGPGVSAGGLLTNECETTIISNCNLYDNEGGGYLNVGADTSEIDLTGIDGNISDDPLLNDFDYSLTAGSPCIDAGTTGLFAYDIDGVSRPLGAGWDIGAYEFDPAVGIKEIDNIIFDYILEQNFPNPFNPATTIEYSIPAFSELAYSETVSLKIYDVLGREVATLVNEHQRPGNYKVNFNAPDLSSGVYYYLLNAGLFIETKKMLLLK